MTTTQYRVDVAPYTTKHDVQRAIADHKAAYPDCKYYVRIYGDGYYVRVTSVGKGPRGWLTTASAGLSPLIG